MEFKCLACGASQAEAFLLGCEDYYMRIPGRHDYYRCARCSMVQIHPVPQDMSKYYQAYHVHSRKSWLHQVLRRRVMSGGYYAPPKQAAGLRLLDYGCGDGWYLAEMARRGHCCVGFETSPELAGHLSRELALPVFSDAAQLEAEHAGTFDVVTMHFVVEHVSDLPETFRLAHRMLKPGGLFYFSVPDIDALQFRLFGRKWHAIDPPRHLSFPTAPVIGRLAQGTGFSVESLRRFGLPNDIAGSLSVLLLGHFNYLAFCAFLPLSWVWCRWIGQGNLGVRLIKK